MRTPGVAYLELMNNDDKIKSITVVGEKPARCWISSGQSPKIRGSKKMANENTNARSAASTSFELALQGSDLRRIVWKQALQTITQAGSHQPESAVNPITPPVAF